jgi:anthranilate/para-aminobenzoate synthase component I
LWLARHERGILIDPYGDVHFFCRAEERRRCHEDLARLLSGNALPGDLKRDRVAIQHSLDEGQYRDAVDEIRGAIRRGDLYQVNLTRRFVAPGRWNAFELYLAITGDEPPRCSAFMNGGRWQIASASPEVFLRYDAGAAIAESRPIKGTIERTGDDAADTEWLRASRKDASEHLMIVDLIRNDFGKVAPAGEVSVASFRDVVTLAHVIHLESTVRAERLERPFDEVFAAMFPSGSITGAPKRAVVQCIRELEPVPRGVYTGAIGFWDYRGRSEWSVAIRTAVIAGDHARYHAGGGVVWDSTPEAEERESVAKARAFLDYCGIP